MPREEYRSREGKERYQRYLNSSHWRKTRLRALEHAGWRCEGEITEGMRCTATEYLQVHHLHYQTLGRESLKDLECLCAACHTFEHLNSCAFCEEPIFDSRQDMEWTAELDGAILGSDPLDVLEDALSWHPHWPYCQYHAHVMAKDD